MLEKTVITTALLFSVFYLALGSYMLVAPEPWYWAVPGVPDTGPFNQHFIRDIGINFAVIGATFGLGVYYQAHRIALWAPAATWLAGHALFHVWEVIVGICGPEALARDFVGVPLPGIIGAALVFYAWRQHAA